ncbi:MAG TPA: CHASE2 domain-containing protein [Chitinophagaceae bacterium]
MQSKKPRRIEYLFINLFVFALAGLLYLSFSWLGFLEPIRSAERDFKVTDLYYSGLPKPADAPNDIVIVNVGHCCRYQIARMIDSVQNYHPRVIGLDILFSSRSDTGNSYLKAVFNRYSNYVISNRGKFEISEKGAAPDTVLVREDSGYANLAGIDKEHATVRYFYPYFNKRMAFATAVIKKYEPTLALHLDSNRNESCEIRYTGGESAFYRLDYSSLLAGSIDSNRIKDHIVLFGFTGAGPEDSNARHYTIDEDKLFTPLNDRLSGRSYPDMYGVIVHANILRMMLRGEYSMVVPFWGIWLITFLISWLLIPFFCKWYYTKGAWVHVLSRLLQLGVCAVLLAGSLLLYHYARIRIEPLIPVFVVLLLVDFILFYNLFRRIPE